MNKIVPYTWGKSFNLWLTCNVMLCLWPSALIKITYRIYALIWEICCLVGNCSLLPESFVMQREHHRLANWGWCTCNMKGRQLLHKVHMILGLHAQYFACWHHAHSHQGDGARVGLATIYSHWTSTIIWAIPKYKQCNTNTMHVFYIFL